MLLNNTMFIRFLITIIKGKIVLVFLGIGDDFNQEIRRLEL